ncbi:MAG: hypothetical protein LUE98_21195 [Tannerellaceae bacterium]|nr:hypothetical protein [Tannerellaceae bacterium]
MYYKIENGKLISWADYKYEEDCLYTDICIQAEVDKDKDIVSIENGILIKNPNYETEQAEKRETEFNNNFFLTSLGYIRRKVTMATGGTKDFLSDLLPVISLGIQAGQEVTIITYNEPDFTQDLTTEYMESLQETKTVTSEFIQECFLQLSSDFLGG